MLPKVYIVAGPTCAGKTAIAIALAKKLGTAIISADSRQCYMEMTIGTAKPTPAELHEIKHYFIDEFPVSQPLTAADYEKLALGYLDEIFTNNNTAVVCGGTGLYIKALCEGLDDAPAVDEAIAQQVNEQYKTNGIAWLREAIQVEDPGFYETGEIHNPARLIRALSFIRSNGVSIKSFHSHTRKERAFNCVKTVIELPRPVLYERINTRVDEMMEHGLLDEVRGLYEYRHLKNLQTVGYSELFEYINGNCTLEEAVEKIKQNTRNYAKRQLTWFRKDKEFTWLLGGDTDAIVNQILEL